MLLVDYKGRKKSGKSKSSNWTTEEEDNLEELFEQFKGSDGKRRKKCLFCFVYMHKSKCFTLKFLEEWEINKILRSTSNTTQFPCI